MLVFSLYVCVDAWLRASVCTFAGMSYTNQPSAWPVDMHMLRVRTDYCSVGDEEVAYDQY